jgi:hypothetical protein
VTAWRTTALALALVIGLAFAAVLSGERTFADAGWLGTIAPARIAAGHAIAAGTVPGWWDSAGLGVPLCADAGHGALYPPTWLAAAGARWLDAIAIAHLWLFGLGVAGLARRASADAGGALVAGAAAALAGIASGALVSGAVFSLAWTPLAAIAALAIARARETDARVRPAIGLALAIAAAALAGAPRVALWTAAAAIAVIALDGQTPRRTVRALGWTLAALALGALTAAVQLAPALLHAVAGSAAGASTAAPGPRVMELVAPGAAPAAGWPSLAGGGAIVALAALAPLRMRALALALALAGAIAPEAAAVSWAFCAALAGVGLTSIADGGASRHDHLRALAVVGALAVTLAAAAALRYPLAAAIDRADLDGAALVERGLARGALAVAAAATVIGGALFAARRRSAGLAAAAGLLAVVEVAIAGHAAVPRMARPGRPALALADGTVTRVFRSVRAPLDDDAAPAERVTAALDRLTAASGAPWGVAAVPAADPARLAVEDRLAGATAAVATRLLDRFAIARAVVPASITIPAELTVLARRGGEALVAFAPGRPAAFWTTRWRRATDDDVLDAIAPGPGRAAAPLAIVHLAPRAGGDPADHGADDGGPLRACAITRARPERIALACVVTAPGQAVLLEAWAPGWTATVDGRAAAVERADLLARAVAVPAGARTIVFGYRPPGLALGALVSALALVNLALAAWLTHRPRRRAPRRSDAPPPP